MITWIGLCAGEIWQHLDKQNGESSLEKLFSEVRAPEGTIWMALGWLAREGHIVVHGLSPDSKIVVKTKENKNG